MAGSRRARGRSRRPGAHITSRRLRDCAPRGSGVGRERRAQLRNRRLGRSRRAAATELVRWELWARRHRQRKLRGAGARRVDGLRGATGVVESSDVRRGTASEPGRKASLVVARQRGQTGALPRWVRGDRDRQVGRDRGHAATGGARGCSVRGRRTTARAPHVAQRRADRAADVVEVSRAAFRGRARPSRARAAGSCGVCCATPSRPG
jgi:hypothetical protein